MSYPLSHYAGMWIQPIYDPTLSKNAKEYIDNFI